MALLVTMPCDVYLEVFSFSLGIRVVSDELSDVGTTSIAEEDFDVPEVGCFSTLLLECFSFFGDDLEIPPVEENPEIIDVTDVDVTDVDDTEINVTAGDGLLVSNDVSLVLFESISVTTHDSFPLEFSTERFCFSFSNELITCSLRSRDGTNDESFFSFSLTTLASVVGFDDSDGLSLISFDETFVILSAFSSPESPEGGSPKSPVALP